MSESDSSENGHHRPGSGLRSPRDKHKEDGSGQVFRFKRLRVNTTPRVNVYADNARIGRTPATVTAEVSALRVRLPS